MKKLTISIIIIVCSISCYGQIQVFKNYDFEEGCYSILGAYSESDPNTLRDSLGEFYTEELSLLNQFKEAWTFTEPGKKYACGYHYNIYLCKNGIVLKKMSVNLNCNEILTDEGYFYFDNEKLRMFYDKFQRPTSRRENFQYLQEARTYRHNILNEDHLIMTPTPDWTKYEGTFQFEYECEDSENCFFDNIGQALKKIHNIIEEKYPDEEFELNDRGGSRNSIYIEVKCNKTLSDKFQLFKRKEYSRAFKPYRLNFKTYWK